MRPITLGCVNNENVVLTYMHQETDEESYARQRENTIVQRLNLPVSVFQHDN